MAKFDAATAVEPMDFDLSAYGGPSGTIPEPTDKQIEKFFDAMQRVTKKVGVQPGQQMSPEAISAIPDDMANLVLDGMLDALEGIGGGSFTRADIEALPFRIKAAFFAWIARELSPEASAPGTKG